MEESDTPRTDKLMHGGCIAINILEHARELERENSRLKDELDRAIYGCGCDNYLQIYCDKHNPYNKQK